MYIFTNLARSHPHVPLPLQFVQNSRFKMHVWMTLHCCVFILCVIQGCGGDCIVNMGGKQLKTNTKDNYSIFVGFWGMEMKQVHGALFIHDGVYCGPHYRDAKGKSHYKCIHNMHHNQCRELRFQLLFFFTKTDKIQESQSWSSEVGGDVEYLVLPAFLLGYIT